VTGAEAQRRSRPLKVHQGAAKQVIVGSSAAIALLRGQVGRSVHGEQRTRGAVPAAGKRPSGNAFENLLADGDARGSPSLGNSDLFRNPYGQNGIARSRGANRSAQCRPKALDQNFRPNPCKLSCLSVEEVFSGQNCVGQLIRRDDREVQPGCASGSSLIDCDATTAWFCSFCLGGTCDDSNAYSYPTGQCINNPIGWDIDSSVRYSCVDALPAPPQPESAFLRWTWFSSSGCSGAVSSQSWTRFGACIRSHKYQCTAGAYVEWLDCDVGCSQCRHRTGEGWPTGCFQNDEGAWMERFCDSAQSSSNWIVEDRFENAACTGAAVDRYEDLVAADHQCTTTDDAVWTCQGSGHELFRGLGQDLPDGGLHPIPSRHPHVVVAPQLSKCASLTGAR
jgi:hypothetical protein